MTIIPGIQQVTKKFICRDLNLRRQRFLEFLKSDEPFLEHLTQLIFGAKFISRLKKTSAKNQQKLMVLYQPEDPNRRKFIDEVIKFHEEKGQPLKGPPMFAQAPLDLYMLYHHVKRKNGMNEVIYSFYITFT